MSALRVPSRYCLLPLLWVSCYPPFRSSHPSRPSVIRARPSPLSYPARSSTLTAFPLFLLLDPCFLPHPCLAHLVRCFCPQSWSRLFPRALLPYRSSVSTRSPFVPLSPLGI